MHKFHFLLVICLHFQKFVILNTFITILQVYLSDFGGSLRLQNAGSFEFKVFPMLGLFLEVFDFIP